VADLFDRAGQAFGGSFASDAAKVIFSGAGELLGGASSSGAGGVGLLTQNLQVGYNQQVTRLYEIGTNLTFLVAGRTQGQLSMGRVLGPRPVSTAFYQKYGNVCYAATNNLLVYAQTGCPQGPASGNDGGLAEINFGVKNVVLTSISLTVAAMDMIINEQLSAMFVSLELS